MSLVRRNREKICNFFFPLYSRKKASTSEINLEMTGDAMLFLNELF